MALIVLVVAWAAFLLPGVLRARAENRPSGSISDFRRQLRVLARTSPAASGSGSALGFPGSARPLSGPVGMRRPMASGSWAPSASSSAAPRLVRNRAAVKRRRDIFVGLLVAMAGSLVLGFLPPLRALWAVHVALDVLFAAYVGLLVYARNLAAERDMKVRFLPTAGRVAHAPEPALLYHRSAN